MSPVFHIPYSQTSFPTLYLATTARQLSSAITPLLIAPLSERTGRRPIYIISWTLFIIGLIPSAVATNFATIVVGRIIDGGASAQFPVMVGGTIADMWEDASGTAWGKSTAMALFSFTSVVGIALGPFVDGVIVYEKEWHWIYIVQIIVAAGVFPLLVIAVPETRYHTILANRAKQSRKFKRIKEATTKNLTPTTWVDSEIFITCKQSLVRAGKLQVYEPVVIALTLWLAFVWALLFMFAQSIVQTYTSTYNYNSLQTSIVQLALSAGSLFSLLLSPVFNAVFFSSGDWNRKRPGETIPEARLYMALPGTICFIGGLFWYGWTLHPTLHSMLPATGLFMIGMGIFGIFYSVTAFLTDAYKEYASSALAVAAFGRNALASFVPLAAPTMYTNLGYQWASSLLGFIAVVLGLLPTLFLLWKGEVVRKHSHFMDG